jgi:hypothetical protein
MVERGGRCSTGERSIIPDVGPKPRRLRPAAGKQRNRGVVAVQPFAAQDVRPDQGVDRLQRDAAGSDLVGQGREAEIDALPGVALRLPVQRLMLAARHWA